jgi:hypothetical protein
VTSAAKIEANRRNAQRSTGPKTSAGKTRAARNALGHGLTARASAEVWDIARIEQLATAFLGDLPRTELNWTLAIRVAEAEHKIELIRNLRVMNIDNAERNPATYQRMLTKSDGPKIRAEIIAFERRYGDIGYREVEEIIARLEGLPPDEPLARLVIVYRKIKGVLARLDRYEGEAFAQRRRALAALARERSSE